MKKQPNQNRKQRLSIISAAHQILMWLILGFLVSEIVAFLMMLVYGLNHTFSYLAHLTEIQLKVIEGLMAHNRVLTLPAHSVMRLLGYFGNASEAISNHTDQLGMATNFIQIVIHAAELVVLKIATMLVFLPLFAWLGLVGLIDGLVGRDIRTFSGGRESALLYHRSKAAIFPVLMLPMFIYLVLPVPINPARIFLPFAILFAYLVANTFKHFKKYA